MLHVNASTTVEPHANRQRAIDEINADGGFAILNHPDWGRNFNHISIDELKEMQNYTGIEIYNGSIDAVDDAGHSLSLYKWDMLLSRDAHATEGSSAHALWGYATDDSHTHSGVGEGWCVVNVDEPRRENIVQALATGRFYASTGIEITDIKKEGNSITITTANAQRIVAYKQGYRRFATADATSLTVTIPEDAKFVRFECFGEKEFYAWSQPIFT